MEDFLPFIGKIMGNRGELMKKGEKGGTLLMRRAGIKNFAISKMNGKMEKISG